MIAALKGRLHGNTITLEQDYPAFEGRAVQVTLSPVDESDLQVAGEIQLQMWQEWAKSGPQGPISDEGEPELRMVSRMFVA